MANCWKRLSVFQTACILILLVGIPFLVALIIIYSVYGTGHQESGSCAVFCCYLQGGLQIGRYAQASMVETPEGDIIIEDYTQPTALPVRSLDFPMDEDLIETEVKNPSIGALLENVYYDDHEEMIFKCSVALIGTEWALTVDECVEGGNLSIRIGSNHWSKDGIVEKVTDLIYLRKNENPFLVLLRFDKNRQVLPLKIMNHFSHIYIKSHGWFNFNNFNDETLSIRKKFDKLKSVNIDFFQKDDCSEYKKPKHVDCYITRKSDYCGGRINAPMIDSYDRFVGVHLETLCEENKKFSVVFYIKIHDFNVTLD